MRRAALLTLAFLLGLTGVAGAHLFLSADASVDRGYVKLYAVGSSDLGPVTLAEDGPLGTLALSQSLGDDPQLGPLSAGALPRATRWRCDRLDRRFSASATEPSGTVDTATFAVRTPSCRNRLTLAATARVEPGQVATVTVTDTWGTDDDPAEVCTKKPGGTPDCAPLRFAAGVATHVFTPHARARYLVTVRAPAQRLRRHVAVGVRALPEPDVAPGPTILSTGDSMMQSVDAILGDRLAKRAEVVGDVKIGAAISSDVIVDWAALARQQVAAQHPQATVVFLGTNDRYPIDGVACCGAGWSAKYVGRVRAIMRTYAQHGRGSVIWLTVPAARDTHRAEGQRAVNAALVKAAAGLPTVSILDMAKLFTPDGTYRATMVVNGRRERVRDADGLHLSIPGARLAARAIIDRLKAGGLL